MKKQHCFLFFGLFSFLFSGCSGINNNNASSDLKQEYQKIAKHVISIGSDGELRPLGCKDKQCDKQCEDDYLNNILNNMIKKLEEGKTNEIVFFIHGGLNNESDSIERAKKKYQKISDHKYPIFVIWDSRAFSTYSDHLFRIRQGEESPTAILTSPVYFLTDLGNSIVNAPKSWLVSGKQLMCSTVVSSDNVTSEKDENFCYYPKQDEKSLKKEIENIKDVPVHYDGGDESGSNYWRKFQWAATSPAKLVTVPFAYTMAKPAWDIMLRRTHMLFYTPDDLKEVNYDQKEVKVPILAEEQLTEECLKKRRSGALYQFLDKLECTLKRFPSVKLTLVGHSMGSIVVNRIVAFNPHLPYKNIVHLASADSIGNLFDRVIPYLTKDISDKCRSNSVGCEKDAVQFYSLSLHPDNENRESNYLGTVPSGSLLTWIDNMYTTPETVIDKRSGRWDNMKKAIKFIPKEARSNMHFKIFGISEEGCVPEKENPSCKPQKHGEFDELQWWKDETWWPQEQSGT